MSKHIYTLIKLRLNILFLPLIMACVLSSCGPRSGIHNNTNENVGCGTETKSLPLGCGNVSSSMPGAKLFKQNCAVCHAAHTDQKLTGPGLKGIADRLPQPAEEWFINYVLNSSKVIKSGDAYAKKIHRENGNIDKPVFEGQLSEKEISEIYQYIIRP